MYKLLTINVLYRRLALSLLLAFVIGWLVNAIWPVLFAVCLLIVVWHYQHLYLLTDWLWQSKHMTPPQAKGVWGYIFEGIYQHNKAFRTKQKSLANKIRQYRDGAEALPDAAIVLGEDLTIAWSNKKAQQLIGVKGTKDIGQRIDNLIRAPIFAQYITEADYKQPCSLPSPIHPEIQLEIRFMQYGGDQILLLIRDISQIHRINAMRRDFVANVSHELKTPLTVIRGYVEMMELADSEIPVKWQQSIHAIEGQVTRMNRLVEQLLELSKVEVGQPKKQTPVLMPKLIKQLVQEVTWLNQDKQHEILCQIDNKLDVIGHDTELKSACLNLIVNAITYTNAGGKITISWQKNGTRARFSVKDNGPGIKPEHINRLTERFYRIDPSRSRNTGGSGLGLSIVKHVLQHQKAQLTIKSLWGEGSEFIIDFDTKQVAKA